VVPILGPSNPRDLGGKVVDSGSTWGYVFHHYDITS